MTPQTLRQRLRSETRPWHDAVEKSLDLTASGPSPERYRFVLRVFHGFYRPIEAALPLFAPGQSFDGQDRRKAASAAADLADLGDAGPWPLCDDLPPLDTLARQVGCLYVVEGSTLGGQHIYRHVAGPLGLTPTRGGRFFHGYGPDTGPRWNAFLQYLTGFENQADEVVGSACETFARFAKWIDTVKAQCEPGREP
jgi:heme oxygenase (biliverdin-IX-beta and delta-forming)